MNSFESFMSYREAAENSELDWRREFENFYPGKAEKMGKFMDVKDGFTPAAITEMTDSDLPALFEVAEKVRVLGMSNSYYFNFWQVIRKTILLVLENSPEAIHGLSLAQKENVFGAKIDLGNEEDLYNEVYIYTQRRAELPSGTLDNGATMTSTLEEVNFQNKKNGAKKELVGESLKRALCGVDSQYSAFFRKTKPRQKK